LKKVLPERALVGKLSAAAIAACRMSMSVEFRSAATLEPHPALLRWKAPTPGELVPVVAASSRRDCVWRSRACTAWLCSSWRNSTCILAPRTRQPEGCTVGWYVGSSDGDVVGTSLGDALGSAVGSSVGVADGSTDGEAVGSTVGSADGACVGSAVGTAVGSSVTCTDGSKDGV
jgi:hypothetical protein